jgi:DNA (cytosine-5)-methyltransferase 1
MIKSYAYYNEFNPEAAAWMRELIKRKLIADGEVDERSITDVQADDVRGFVQCHFFAGIGGWSYALRLAGIPDDYPLWTASLPCQPFSVAGKQLGKDDERHLLPHFTELVRQCKPDRIFGEQVEGAIRHGWLDDLQATMEAENYAVGHCVLGAHSVGAFHQRQRLYWVAENKLGDTLHNRARRATRGKMGATQDDKRASESEGEGWIGDSIASRGAMPLGFISDTSATRLQGHGGFEQVGVSQGREGAQRHDSASGIWSNVNWIYCRDEKYRAIEPSIKPLVDGISKGVVRSGDNSEEIDANNTQEARVMRLKGYGNAIVPQVAAMFISAALEVSQ